MSIYFSSKKEFFIDELTEFICTNFRNNLDSLKIILPTGYLCNHLQKHIITKIGTTILPNIIAINDINSSMEETFKIPSEQINKVSNLESKMILTELINSYNNLNYQPIQALNLSSSLVKLFFEFEANDIDFTALKNIPTLDQAEHWHFIYDFLEFTYRNWQTRITDIKKLTPAKHQRLMFDAELNRLKNVNNYTIIAGVIGNNKLIKDFIIQLAKFTNSHIILPPFTSSNSSLPKIISSPDEPLYNIYKLLTQLGAELQNIPYLNKKAEPTILDKLLVNNDSNYFTDNIDIEYIEFDNIILEAEYAAKKSSDVLAKNPNSKIAVLITDNKIKNYFKAEFDKYDLVFSDLIGENILDLSVTSFIIEVAQNTCKKFSLKNFVSLILHPLIICDETRKLKQLITKHNRFAQNIEDISTIINSNFTDYTQLEKLNNICKFLVKNIQSFDICTLLQETITVAKEIYPNLWQGFYNNKVASAIAEILGSNWSLKLDNLGDFPDILQELLSGGRIYNDSNHNSAIVFCSANEVTLVNYDLIIYTNFILNSYPMAQINSPWLNKHMIEQIGLDSLAARFGNYMYDFYLNLHNKKILITRSVKTDNSSISMPSPFILSLKHILGDSLKQISFNFLKNSQVNNSAECVYTDFFPKQLSATDIETLLRAPYNFYAKKILGLKKEKEIQDDPSLSEFGNYFHKVAELYTKNYELDQSIALDKFNNYAEELLTNAIFPKQTKNFWLPKIRAIAKDFISFDNKRRQDATQIIAETKGEFLLDVYDTKIKITAIADRIEITKKNKAVILDYKTGTIPTKKDILSGLSPQLIIESIILLEGGFSQLGNKETQSLVYVKINSQEPYISTIEIAITRDDILKHKNGLINLLHHYITTGKYPIEPNLMHYDDYWHLARRSS